VPQKRDDKTALTIIVVVVAILIIVPLILSAVLYIMVSGLIGEDMSPHEPNIQLSAPTSSAGNLWRVDVAGVSDSEPLYEFRALLMENGTWLDELDPLAEGTPAPLSFTDLAGGRTLTAGDSFTITCKPGSYYELVIIWRVSDNKVGGEDWYT
jgi:hypothetical protein